MNMLNQFLIAGWLLIGLACDPMDETNDDTNGYTETCTDTDSDSDTGSDADTGSDTNTNTDSDTNGEPGLIYGYVLWNENPVDGASLEIWSTGEEEDLGYTTSGGDETGYYEFVVGPGNYTIEASYWNDDCYFNGFVKDIMVTSGESVQLDISVE